MTTHSIGWYNAHNVRIDVPLASLGTRILAYLMDMLIIFTYAFFALFLYSEFVTEFSIWTFFILLLPAIFYHLLFELYNDGQSPGKRLLNIKVTNMNGQAAPSSAILLRWIFRLIDFSIFNGIIALLSVAFTDYRQRIGDLVAGTVVIDSRLIQNNNRFIYTPVVSDYEPRYPQAAHMHSDDVDLIREVLNMEIGHAREELVGKLMDKIISTYEISPQDPPKRFLFTLVKDFNHYQLLEEK